MLLKPIQRSSVNMHPRVYKTEGIVLRRRNSGEADKILTLYTKEHGKVRILAKGIRKIASRRAPHLEIFTHVRLIIHQGKMLDSVGEAITIHRYRDLRQSLERISLAYYVCELVDGLTPEKQEHTDVFELLIKALSRLNESNSINQEVIIYSFSRKLLDILGFLDPTKNIDSQELERYIEQILEKRLRSTKMIRQVS